MTFNIWQRNDAHRGPTGPWVFMAKVNASTEGEALSIARMRYGIDNEYQAYEGFSS